MLRIVWILALAWLLGACTPEASTYEVTVLSGTVDRVSTPVYLDVDAPAVTEATPVCVRDGAAGMPGQVEPLEGRRRRIWWTVTQPAGASRHYTLHLGEACAVAASFTWRVDADTARTLLLAGRPVLQYVHPVFNPAHVQATNKPFHHVFDPVDGTPRITKGVGGLHEHHRGLFFGYTEVIVEGDTLNLWWANDGEHQAHVAFEEEVGGPVFGGHTVRIRWTDRQGEPVAEEWRTVRVFRQPAGQTLIDWRTHLETRRGSIRLDGDRHHAGVQFRAAQEVAEHEDRTTFLRPAAWAHRPPDLDVNDSTHVNLPWNAMQFDVGGEGFTVACLTDPANPYGGHAPFSERRYGRFGEFFPFDLTRSRPLDVHYRWWVRAGRDVPRDTVEARYRDLAHPPIVSRP
ncbi:hypothetical protein AWN76_009040 [Rhodothermaceae bacterium RA]|nr:hypothetical protein AWN76_009040 [Rhodothermaceae bacterium RA]